MKITGYKIKELLKLIERLQNDIPLQATFVPTSMTDTGAFFRAQCLNENFEKHQVLAEDISRLKMIQMKYNTLVKVGEDMTLAEAIQQSSKISGLSTKIEKILKESEAAKHGERLNREHCEPSQMYAQGRAPRYEVPAIDENDVKKILRKFRSEETKIKNMIGYGNSVEIEMLDDDSGKKLHYLFDENRLQNFNLSLEKVRIASENTGKKQSMNIGNDFPIFLNEEFIKKALSDIPDASVEEKSSAIADLKTAVEFP